MNKRSVKKKRPAKPSQSTTARKATSRQTVARKADSRKAIPRKARTRHTAVVSEPINTAKIAAVRDAVSTVTIAQVRAIVPTFQTHRYRVGQTVFYTSSPISRPGATGTYEVVRLLPSDGDDYQYRIKNSGEAFERVAKESQLELEH